ncbi:hypothetical protein DIE19_03130 [Burkholderia sp. Bp9126]|nr:hypothetical protein DIE19_03130 [Burkholderia sp. Bp9126]
MKSGTFARSATAVLAGLSISASALGAIDLLPKELVVHDKAVPVRIVNNGDRAEYVSISLSRLLNPGVPLDDEKLEPVGDAAQPTLYAFPFRVSLGPGQSKIVTVKPVRPVESETVYRLNVEPVVKVLGDTRKETAGNIVVNLAFSGLVRQLPASERSSLAVTCDAHGARVTATGNVRVAVKGAHADGQPLDDFNVYPAVPLPVKGRVVTIPGHPACNGDSNPAS